MTIILFVALFLAGLSLLSQVNSLPMLTISVILVILSLIGPYFIK